jgi:hypothetical protein
MNRKVFFSLLLISLFPVVQGKSQYKGFNRSVFYSILKSGTADEINTQINRVKESLLPEKEAYEGALLMKGSEKLSKAKDKLNMFKSGRSKLESSISKNKTNIEYRFIRLIIQEHAPKIVKYREEMEEDSKLIQTNFQNLSVFLQQLIIDYSKDSRVLKIP